MTFKLSELDGFELPKSFSALNARGESVLIETDGTATLLDVDDVPVALVNCPDGGGAWVSFASDPPRLFSAAKAGNEGVQIDGSEFVRLIRASRSQEL